MESEEILGPQFSVHWSPCSPILGKRFPIPITSPPITNMQSWYYVDNFIIHGSRIGPTYFAAIADEASPDIKPKNVQLKSEIK